MPKEEAPPEPISEPEQEPTSSSIGKGEGFQLGKRIWISIKGSFLRNTLRLLAGIASFFVLGFFGMLCKLNYIGTNFGNLSVFDYIKAIFSALYFGVKRSAVLMWFYLTPNGTVDYRLGIIVMLFFVIGVFLIAIYNLVAIPIDALDGHVKDKAPFWVKAPIALSVAIMLSGLIFITTDKPEGDYEVNINLILDKYSSDYCAYENDIPLFIPLDGNYTVPQEEDTILQNESMQII